MNKYLYIVGLTLSSFNASFLFGGQKHTEKERQKQEQMRTELKKNFKTRQRQIKKIGKKMRMKEIDEQKNMSSNRRMYGNSVENNNVGVADIENMKTDIEDMKESIRSLVGVVSVVKELIDAVNKCRYIFNKSTEAIARTCLNMAGFFQGCRYHIWKYITANRD